MNFDRKQLETMHKSLIGLSKNVDLLLRNFAAQPEQKNNYDIPISPVEKFALLAALQQRQAEVSTNLANIHKISDEYRDEITKSLMGNNAYLTQYIRYIQDSN